MNCLRIVLTIVFSFFILHTYSQDVVKYELRGAIKDAGTGEALIGAALQIKPGVGTVADLDGNFSMKVEPGDYEAVVSYSGYESQKIKVKIKDKNVFISVKLTNVTLDEVEIVADVATIRETPVAFSNITQAKIQEELAGRDLAVIANTTPGAYATEQGGGSGDARVSIRGFSQQNVAVMVDGVPVNDMENGAVYWSNWDGLGEITRNVQIQRGLGASKLAIPSVGGTMNIITRGIDSKMSTTVKQDIGNNGYSRTSIGYNSGLIKNKFGVTLAGSYKRGDGWVDQTWVEAYSYFIKFQYRPNNKHLFSLGANGAPQKHGQRTDRLPMAVVNREFAKEQYLKAYGDSSETRIDEMLNTATGYGTYSTVTQGDRGPRYNPSWGVLNGENFNTVVNYYHKPLFNLSHFYSPNSKVTVSTIVYASYGNGGGARLDSGISRDTLTGQLNIQKEYDFNSGPTTINNFYSTTEHKSSRIILASVNNHKWYGGLSTLSWKIDSNFTYTGGIDLRYYRGLHYRVVYDLLGGDYFLNSSDKNQAPAAFSPAWSMKRQGDKITYNNDGLVIWGGLFSQLEYKREKFSAFLTLTGSETGYQRVDYFRKKDLVFGGNLFNEGTVINEALDWGDTVFYNGNNYLWVPDRYTSGYTNRQILQAGDWTYLIVNGVKRDSIQGAKAYTIDSPEARFATTKRKWYLGYTIKGGMNYNIDDHHNVFMNLGYLTMAPRFNNVFDNTNKEFLDSRNQEVIAFELGYGFKHKKAAANVNFYYTLWNNKPPQFTPTINIGGDIFSYNINGLQAIHKGAEFDFIYKLTRKFELEGLFSLGDWRNNIDKPVYIYDQDNNPVDTIDIKANNILVGDAAQIQIGGSLRYEPVKGFYIKSRYIYFAKNYANYDATTLTGDYADKQSWKMPNYGLLELYSGYNFKAWKFNFNVFGTMSNVFNILYVTDAQNNQFPVSNGVNFGPHTAGVHFGQGRRFTLGTKITF